MILLLLALSPSAADDGAPRVYSRSGVELAWIPGDTFWMGSPDDDPDREGDEALHRVAVSGLYVMTTEVTQQLWSRVMHGGSEPPEPVATARCPELQGVSLVDPGYPVICVSWYDAVAFANALSEREGLVPAYTIRGSDVRWEHRASGYRLLTEAEWEHAAQPLPPGSTACERGNVGDLGAEERFGWLRPESATCRDGHTALAPVGSYPANLWGLHDMLGNVAEWVWDPYVPPREAWTVTWNAHVSRRGVRGSSWSGHPSLARPANRHGAAPDLRLMGIGFRVARPAPPPTIVRPRRSPPYP